jgi:hypothetical protein
MTPSSSALLLMFASPSLIVRSELSEVRTMAGG